MSSETTARKSDIAIAANGIGKIYRIWRDPAARLKFPLLQALSGILPDLLRPSALRRRIGSSHDTPYYKNFHALQNATFSIRKGESIGIVGRNGSGKSTLLQIIAGTLTPSSGTFQVKGRVAALLELGSGFNPEFSGRENVYLNAGILGLTRKETEERFEAIREFAEIGDFIDQPVRTYSSGMVVRLAFAVAAHTAPDILIVDEALSVGDARFQLKCARIIDRFIENGATILFVSHDHALIKRICTRALLLEKGGIIFEGHPNDVINLYSKLISDDGSPEKLQPDITAIRNRRENEAATPAVPQSKNDRIAETVIAEERRHVQVSGTEFAYGGELGKISHIELKDKAGESRLTYDSGEEVSVHVVAESYVTIESPIFALTLKNSKGVEIYGTNTLFNNQPAPSLNPGSPLEIIFRFPLNIMTGSYFLSLGLVYFQRDELTVIQRRYDAIKFDVHTKDRAFGIANLHARITCRPLPE